MTFAHPERVECVATLDLPADCRAWLDGVIDAAATCPTDLALEALLLDLPCRLASAPNDLESCDLLQEVVRAQTLQVLEVC